MPDQTSLIGDPFAPQPGVRPGETGTIPRRPTSLISPLGGLDAERLQDAARRAPDTTPDQAARVLRLQRRTGFPIDLIERNVDEIERQTAAADFDVERFRAESPLLAGWLAQQPSHLALVRDDLRSLVSIEGALRVGENAVRSLGAGVLQFNRGFWGVLQAAGEATGLERLAAIGRQGGTGATALAARIRGPQTGVGPNERAVYSGFESLGLTATGLPFAVAGGGAPALLGVLGTAAGGQAYAEARERGVGVLGALTFGLSQGVVEAATERIPASRLLGDLQRHTGFLTTLVRQGVAEIPGEQVATVLQDLNAWAVLHPADPFAAYLEERPSAAAETLIATLVAVGGQTAIVRALDRVTQGPASQRVIEDLGAAARDLKTLGRLPEKVREFVDQATADGPLAAVHLPIEAFTTYFQSQQIDPAQMAERLTGDRQAYARAQQTGEDLAVPMGAYLTELAGTVHNTFFAREARLAPDALNAREEDALEQALAAEIEPGADPSASAGQVRDAVLAQLEAAAIPPATARVYADLFEQAFQAIGTRAGLDPVALFDRYGLTVTREGVTPAIPAAPGAPLAALEPDVVATEVPPSVARPGESPAQQEQRRRSQWAELLAVVLRDAQAVDPTVDPQVIRAEFASRRERFEEGEVLTRESGRDPQNLLRAIADYGGLWHERTGAYRGEIEQLKQSQTAPDQWAGVKGVFRQAGKTPDAMVEALRQDTRFAWIENINDLLDAVDRAVREPVAAATLPGTADLRSAFGIKLGTAWWTDARRTPGAELGDDETRFFQEALNSRRAQLEARIRQARAQGREDLRAQQELQALLDAGGVEPAAALAADTGRDAGADPHDPDFLRQDERGALRFGSDRRFTIDLFKRADLSTVLHEASHLYLEVLSDVVDELGARPHDTLTETQRRMLADFGTLLQWFGAETMAPIGTPERSAQQEQFARGFEAYLMEGRAPSPALRSVFARTRAWLVSIYRAVRALRVELTPAVRGVMDRLLATDDAIDAAQQDAHVRPLFTDTIADAMGLSAADRAAYRATVQAASDGAREWLQAQLLGQLQRERAAWWKEERTTLRAQFAQDIAAAPLYRALALLQRGTRPDGSPLPIGVLPFKLSQDALVEQFGEGVLKRLPRPLVYTTREGVPPSVAAELLGFPSGQALVTALIHATPIAEAIDAAADAEMRQRHGDLLLDGSIADQARQAVLEAGADVFAAELQGLAAAATRQPGGRRVTVPPVSTLRAIAERRIADTLIRDIRPATFAAAARRAGDQAIEAAGRQDFAAALQAKQRQLLNAELYRAATAARDTVDDAIAGFKPIFSRDAALAQRYSLDLVNAARSLLAQFELAPPVQGAAASAYLSQVQRYDPELYADLDAAIEAAAQPGRPYRQLTLDEFIALRDAVANLWHTARRSKQIIIEGKARDLAEVRAELEARLQAIGAPTRRRGYDRAVTQWEKTKLYLLGWRAALRRVESWVDAIDGGDAHGPFRRLLFTSISEAGSQYRVAKKAALERYLTIVRAVEPSLTAHDIAAPEIGYTFGGKMELLHALLHTGNPSNRSKLLRGRNWGQEAPDGSLESSQWDAFLRRLWQDGTLTKADYDYVQAVWDLLEDLKPQAQQVHHDLFGFFFAEITAQPVVTPFGTYRGGYMPAIVDPFLATDAAQRADKEALEQTPTSFMFPTAGRGFTKGRIEPYARPLALDLRIVPAHLDKVLRFIHLEPRVKDAARLVTNKGFRRSLDAFDPTVAGELLVPWLQRAARQTVDTPAQGWGGRGADRVFRGLRRRTGMQIMVGNVLNALQQVTGLSISALKVPPAALARALYRYVRQPAVLTALITEKSAFMATRTTTQTMEVQQHIDDLLLNPSTYDQARAFATHHGYFLQQATQNIVDVITWSGAYDRANADGATEPEAVRQADAAVRATQGSFNPEDLSAFETGTPLQRAFTMFYSYWNMLANTLGTEFAIVVRDLGLKAGAGRALYVYTFGFLVPALLSELIIKAGRGEPWDEDEDGLVLDDFLAFFFGAQRRAATAMLPGVGTAINAGLNAFNDKWYDDRISVSPAVSAIESAVRSPYSVYQAIVNDGRRKTAIRDTLTLIGLLTGLPLAPLGRPLGYAADVLEGEVDPSGPVDVARGLVTGR